MAGESTATPFGNGAYIPDPLAQFLGRVLPTIAGPSDGYVNVHAFGGVRTPYQGGGQAFAGMAEYGALQDFVRWLNHNESDVFFCLSTQSHDGAVDGRGKRKVGKGGRARKNAVRLKALVLDLDVKPTGYPSQRAALAHLLPFCEKHELEPLLVSSGRGLHAYIILDAPVTLAVWQPLADRLIATAQAAGLKFDVGVTRNPATLLRLPTTFNRKDRSTPLECRVLSAGSSIIVAELGALLAHVPASPRFSPRPNEPSRLDPAVFPRRQPINGQDMAAVRADIEHARIVTSVELLRAACPVVADSDQRGGDGDREPLWFELAKLCHYVEGGQDYFHDLSSEDARYDPEQTDQKYEGAQPQGWPACATIAAASPDAKATCTSCPHYGQGRSPIHFARSGQVNGTVNGHAHPAATPAISVVLDLPDTLQQLPDGRLITADQKLVFHCPIIQWNLTSRPDGAGGFDEGVQIVIPSALKGDEKYSVIETPCSTFGSASQMATLIGKGLTWPNVARAKDSAVDLIAFARSNRASYKTARHGWEVKDGKIIGFNFGNTLFTAEGPQITPARSHHWYTPTGDLAAWKRAANTYVGKGLVDHEILIATGFAAPLMQFTLVDGATVLARSGATGIGKTAMLETANSVWAHRHAVMRAGTINATVSRLATLHNLPGCFDDMPIRNGKFSQLITPVTSGKDKDRLNRAGEEVEPRTLRTLLIVTSNESLAQTTDNPDTNALTARVFEFQMTHSVNESGVPDSERLDARNSMEMNYGMAGMVVAEFFGRYHEAAKVMVSDTVANFKRALRLGDEARFWTAAAAAIFVGATIAKKLGLINFDTSAIHRRLCEMLRQQKSSMRDMNNNADDPDVQADRLAEFLNENLLAILRTDFKPAPGNKTTTLENGHELGNTREYVARIARVDKWMLVSAAKLAKWCRQRGTNPTSMKSVLISAGRCIQAGNRRSLTAQLKVGKRSAEEYLLEFDLSLPANERFLPQ